MQFINDLMETKYSIFISYRREGGFDTAKHLSDLLTHDGYTVSFDIDTLRNGDFDSQLLSRIDECKDFILIVNKHAFERTLDPTFNPQKDWLRCELTYAIEKNKNIIPVFLSGANGFPENLPSDLAAVYTKNGPSYSREYFDAFYDDLKERFLLSTPHSHRKRYFKRIASIGLIVFVIIASSGIALQFHENEEKESRFAVCVNQADGIFKRVQYAVLATGDERACQADSIAQALNLYTEALKLNTKDGDKITAVSEKKDLMLRILSMKEQQEELAGEYQRFIVLERLASARQKEDELNSKKAELYKLIVEYEVE